MSLTSCLKKAGKLLHPEDKSAILASAKEYRAQGLSSDDAGRKAIDDRIAEHTQSIEALRSATTPEEAAGASLDANGRTYRVGDKVAVSFPGTPNHPNGYEKVAEVKAIDGDQVTVLLNGGKKPFTVGTERLGTNLSAIGKKPPAKVEQTADATRERAEEAAKVESKKAHRQVERDTFNEMVQRADLVGKSVEDITKLIVSRGVLEDRVRPLATAIHRTLAKNAKELAKQQYRDPTVRAEGFTAALRAAIPVIDDRTTDRVASVGAGFAHALAGRTKSTLAGDNLADKMRGFDEAQNWIKTEEGAAWYEGRPVNKLQNTGVDLRRHYEQLQAQMKRDESDVTKAWSQIERATNRADLFAPLLPEGVSPGMRTYVEHLRNNVKTFKEWLEAVVRWDGHEAYDRHAAARASKNIERIVSGDRYPPGDDEFQNSEHHRIGVLQGYADQYVKAVRDLVSFAEGTSSVKEAAEKFEARYIDSAKVAAAGPAANKRRVYGADHFLTPAAKKLMETRGGVWSGVDYDLANMRASSNWAEHLIEKEHTLELANRTTPLTAPRLATITRTGGEDLRKGRNVTPQEVKDAFGFADIGFGKWVGAKQDQDHLNYAFDAFHDLAKHFGIDPKVVGFGGRLHLTIGALGHGKAAAHFATGQPGPNGPVEVINLTNTKGDGTVLHEWTHALDHFLGANFGTKETKHEVVRQLDRWLRNGVPSLAQVERRARQFLLEGWFYRGDKRADKVDAAMRALRTHPQTGETAYAKNADALGPDYWGNRHEMMARAFEAWGSDTLGFVDDYLVNPAWVGDGTVTKDKGYRGTPYPTGAERTAFNEAIGAFAKALKFSKDGVPSLSREDFLAALPESIKNAIERLKLLSSDRASMEALRDRFLADQQALEGERKAEQDAKKRAEQEELDRLAAEAMKNVVVDAPQPSQTQGPLAADDLGAIFDEAAAELQEQTSVNGSPVTPAAAPAAAPAAPAPKAAPAAEAPTATAALAEAAKLGVKGADEALRGLAKLFGAGGGRLNSFGFGFDEDTYRQAKPHFKAALDSFQAAGQTLKDYFKFLITQFGEGIKQYAIRFAQDEGLTAQLGSQPSASMKLAQWVRGNLNLRREMAWQELFTKADEAFGGTQAQGKYTVKDAYDAAEAGMNAYILANPDFTPEMDADKAVFAVKQLAGLTAMLPTQTKRTAEQDAFQQFSTVPPFAFVANWVARPTALDTMLEPSAGIGGLAVFAKNAGARLILNELSTRRAAVLQEVFPSAQVLHENAEQLDNILPADVVPTVVVMNPPFSATAGRVSTNSTDVGALHVEQALKRLAPGGRLVAIVGEGMARDKPAFKAWWSKIDKQYDVRAAIPVNGAGYAKYGTTFDNALLVIDKRGPQSGRIVVTTRAEAYTDLIPLLAEVRDDRPAIQAPGPSEADSAERDAAESARGGAVPAGQGGATTGGAPSERTGDVGVGGNAGPGRDVGGSGHGATGTRGAGGSRSGGERTGGRAGPDAGANAQGGGGQHAVPAGGPVPAGGVAVSSAEAQNAALTDSIFEPYAPQRLKVEGAQPHPGPLVQSAAMASVVPPAPTYTPNLPKEAITKGKLSLAQIEAVVYAGQAHGELLPSGERRGYFIGDGTGVGKGREIGGIILDNLRQGRRRHVWVSEKQGLMVDAARDFEGVGGDPKIIFNQSTTKAPEPIDRAKQGILFTTYATLRAEAKGGVDAMGAKVQGQTRLEQLVKYLGEDFDGVIAFDEAHNAGNAIAIKGARGPMKPSAQALAVVELQKRLPKARVVYVSATGATEVSNLSFANRLGLWGDGTSFENVGKFIGEMAAGGLATMELVARDMKQMGAYIARSLSYDGIVYSRLEHQLTPIQRDIYDRLAQAWQVTLKNFDRALELTGAKDEDTGKVKNSKAIAAAKSAYWSAQQRFFNQVITSMQMPTVLEQVQKDIDAGHAVVLQLVNTNEAALDRALERRTGEDENELEELDLTPRDQLIEMVRKSFPTQEYEDVEDEHGNLVSMPVMDSKGNPVENKEAVALREKLLQDLKDIKVPDGPLESLLNAFGPKKVAEVTGRSKRVYFAPDEKGVRKRVEEKRGATANRTDAQAFMDDKKPILVFSDAGGTGFSFQAARDAKNQRQRKHYLLQPGWRANKAVQGLGRTHRSNQVSVPQFGLVSTDIPAQKRFLSSIARRLDQLGALTKGQRDTANQGLFSEKDNLESKYATGAVRQLLESAQDGGKVGPYVFKELLSRLGLDNIIDAKTGKIADTKFPDVPHFLNRILSLELDPQKAVFDDFIGRMEALVQTAAREGTLDTGMQTIRALDAHAVRDEVVHTDKKTGAETRYVELELTQPTRIYELPEQATGVRFYKRSRDGKVASARKAGTETTKGGQVLDSFSVRTTNGYDRKDAHELARNYSEIEYADFAAKWAEENAARPKTFTQRAHLITGALLPIWDRLGDIGVEVVRTQTDDGKRYLGRRISALAVKDVLKRLNVDAGYSKLTGAQVIEKVLKGANVELANGWRLERAKVSNELRVELKNVGYAFRADAAIRQGLMHERIQWTDRFFVPTSTEGAAALAKILETKPVTDIIESEPLASRDPDAPARGPAEPEPVRGLPVIQLTQQVKTITTGWKNAPSGGVHVVPNARALPSDLRSFDPKGDARAWFDPKTEAVYLVADKLKTPEEAQFALFHEVYGHYGLRAFLGNGYAATMMQMRRANPGLATQASLWYARYGDAEVVARMQRGMDRAAAEREVRLVATEEALADRAAEAPAQDKLKFLFARLQRALRAMHLGAVADWLENHTDAEVIDLLTSARHEVQQGGLPHALPSETPLASRSALDGLRDMDRTQIAASLNDVFRSQRTFNWWHRTVGTQYHKAQVDPEHFGAVFHAAQDYLHDTSALANDAGNLAPDLLPQLQSLKDLKRLAYKQADRDAIQAPLFEGTLMWTRDDKGELVPAGDVSSAGVIFTPAELKDRFNLTDHQVRLYQEFRGAVDRSLDTLVASDVARYMDPLELPKAVKALVAQGDVGRFKGLVNAYIGDRVAAAQKSLDEATKAKDKAVADFEKAETSQGEERANKLTALTENHDRSIKRAERVLAKWNEAQADVAGKYERIDDLKARGYAPLMRFGRYTVTAHDAEGKVVFFSMYEGQREANAAARALNDSYKAAEETQGNTVTQGVMSQKQFELFRGVTPETMALFADKAGMRETTLFQQYLQLAISNRSALKRLIHRKGVAGYSEDAARVLAQFLTSNARAASGNLHLGEIDEHIANIPQERGDVIDEAKKLRDYVTTPGAEAQALRGLLFTSFIGGSVASAAVNLTQSLTTTLPYLSQFSNPVAAAAHVARAMVDAVKGVSDPTLKAALERAERDGVVSPQEIHQLQAEASRSVSANRGVRAALFAWGSLFSVAEQFNRRAAFIAAYRMAIERNEADPFKFAEDAVDATQFVYNKGNRPDWARGAIGATLFTFKQFTVSYVELLKRLPPREKALAFAILLLAAGAQGLPLADDLDDVIDAIGQGLGYDWNTKLEKTRFLANVLGDGAADFVMHGFSAIPGMPMDVAGRLSLGNVFPGTGLLVKSKDKSHEAQSLLGPAGSLAQNVGAAMKGDYMKLAPSAVQNIAKGIDMLRTGMYRDDKGRQVMATSTGEALEKMLGFQPAPVAAEQRKVGMAMQQIELAKTTQSEITSKWAQGVFEKDPDKVAKAREQLRDWNATNPDSRIQIKPESVVQQVRAMAMTRDQRLLKGATPGMRKMIAEIPS